MTDLDWESRARGIEAMVLRRLGERGQAAAAQALQVSESAISRLKDGQITTICRLIAFLGLKVVPEEYREVNPEVLAAFITIYKAAVKARGDSYEFLYAD